MYTGPDIITDGLVLYLDAANTKSYPQTVPVWKDLSGNGNDGTLVNGPTFDSGNLGSISFDGIDDYVSTLPGSYSEYTVNFVCKWISSVGVQERLFGTNASGTYTIRDPSNINFHYNPLGGSPPSVSLSSNVNVGYGKWTNVTLTVSALNTEVKIYVNGILRNSSSVIPSVNLSGTMFIGAQNTSVRANCSFGFFQAYNRALTAEEILQNYNATKSRYGL
jgi:hypothetical protein